MRRSRSGKLWILALLTPAAVSNLAHGQGPAQAQFDYGLAEMEAGRYESGCAALGESYRFDPHPGVLFTLAECENRWGKIASALAHYEAYLDLFEHMSAQQQALQRGRDKVSIAQRDKLRAQVPELTITMPSQAPPGTTVMRDGMALAAPSLGIALPVDPGEHVVVARTRDGVSHPTKVTLARGEHRLLIVDLTPAPPGGLTAAEARSERPVTLSHESALATHPSRTGLWIAGGAGTLGLATGIVAGALVLADKSTVDAHCGADNTCDPQGLGAARRARTAGIVSDVGFGVGAAGVAVAIVLFVTSAPKRTPGPALAACSLVGGATTGGAIVGLRAAW